MAGLYDIVRSDVSPNGDHICWVEIDHVLVLVDAGVMTPAQAKTSLEEDGATLDAAAITDLTALLAQLAAAPDKTVWLRKVRAVMGLTEMGRSIATEVNFRNQLGI